MTLCSWISNSWNRFIDFMTILSNIHEFLERKVFFKRRIWGIFKNLTPSIPWKPRRTTGEETFFLRRILGILKNLTPFLLWKPRKTIKKSRYWLNYYYNWNHDFKHQLKDCCLVNWLNLTPWTILATCLYMYTSWRPCFVATHSWSFHFLFCN